MVLRKQEDHRNSLRDNKRIKLIIKGEIMAQVIVKDNESLESAIRRFKRNIAKDQIMIELKKREFFVKPSLKRKLKSEEARKTRRLMKY